MYWRGISAYQTACFHRSICKETLWGQAKMAFVISSCIVDIPESRDCLSIKQGVLNSLPCPRCVTPVCDMDQYWQSTFQDVEDMLPILSDFFLKRWKCMHKIWLKDSQCILSNQSFLTYSLLARTSTISFTKSSILNGSITFYGNIKHVKRMCYGKTFQLFSIHN